MTVLVAYASRHGSTAEIAERIGADLRQAGLVVDVRDVDEAEDLVSYDAFVVGSAAYMFHWLKRASAFVKGNREVLAVKPVWLFSSGPLGTDLVDDEGRDVLETTRPKEFDAMQTMINPRDERVFFGAWDAEFQPVGFGERLLRLMPGTKASMPVGDFRDWLAIDAWAVTIASELQPEPSSDRLAGGH